MFFLQAGKARVPVTGPDGVVYKVPKFPMTEVMAWGEQIKGENTAIATKGMSEDKRREYLQFYPPISPNLREMRIHLASTKGTHRVIAFCMNKAGMPEAQLAEILTNDTFGVLAGLAWELADLDDASARKPPTAPDEGENSPDPLQPNTAKVA